MNSTPNTQAPNSRETDHINTQNSNARFVLVEQTV